MKHVLVLAALCAALAAHADTFRKHATRFKVGPNPSAIAAADLNGDGIPEIVTADRGRLADARDALPGHDQLSLLSSTDGLKYQRVNQLSTGFGPYAIAIAGQDVVAVSFMATQNHDLTLLRNIGDNLFEPRHFQIGDESLPYRRNRDGDGVPIFTTPGLTSLAVRDVDGDGLRDAVVTAWSSDFLVVLPGSSEHDFGEPRFLALPGGPRDVAIGDLDGDGRDDLAVALYTSNQISVWKGDGRGGFEEANRFASGGTLPQSVRIADFNGDGIRDLAAAHRHSDDSVVLHFGAGKLEFDTSQTLLFGADRRIIEAEIHGIVAADLNADGRTDLGVACPRLGEVAVMINASRDAALPQKFVKERYAFPDGEPRALCVADFDRDGKPDLGVALWRADAVGLLLGR